MIGEDELYARISDAIVDKEDLERLSAINWHMSKSGKDTYARSKKHGYMHRMILGVTDPLIYVDHINHNTLDNRKTNLRVSNNSKNQANRRKHTGTSRYKGVSLVSSGSWEANVMKDKKHIYIGRYKLEEDAAKAYNLKAIELFGEHALVNNLNKEKL